MVDRINELAGSIVDIKEKDVRGKLLATRDHLLATSANTTETTEAIMSAALENAALVIRIGEAYINTTLLQTKTADDSKSSSKINKDEEVTLIEYRMPLVVSCLDIAMKKRCVDISFSLIEKISNERKSKALTENIKSGLDGITFAPITVPMETAIPSDASSAPVPAPAVEAVKLIPNPIDTVPQAACQLLIHVLREEEIRLHFKGLGGAHRIMTSIPPFEGIR
jgi:hypothetical protein